jgi:NADPH:quinone reductase-like Zn-dependent oxidoreductase
MKCYRFDALNGIEDLTLHEEDQPVPQRGEVLVKVLAVSLNFRDVAVVMGRYVHAAKAGLIPTSDAAGVVVAVGDAVQDFKPGDRVVGAFHPRWFGGPVPSHAFSQTYGSGSDGWLAEYKVVSQEAVVKVPDGLGDFEASTLPCAATTAWTALSGHVPIRAGHTVLTQGTGGVSIFAVQLAKALGARVISTTSSSDKEARLRDLGADEVINYSKEVNWDQSVRRLTGMRGVDRVVEVGGPATINKSISAVARDGEIAMIGFLTTENPGIDYFHLKSAAAITRGIAVGDRVALQEVIQVVVQRNLKPVIDKVFGFEEAREAFAYLQSGRQFGKIIVQVGS